MKIVRLIHEHIFVLLDVWCLSTDILCQLFFMRALTGYTEYRIMVKTVPTDMIQGIYFVRVCVGRGKQIEWEVIKVLNCIKNSEHWNVLEYQIRTMVPKSLKSRENGPKNKIIQKFKIPIQTPIHFYCKQWFIWHVRTFVWNSRTTRDDKISWRKVNCHLVILLIRQF